MKSLSKRQMIAVALIVEKRSIDEQISRGSTQLINEAKLRDLSELLGEALGFVDVAGRIQAILKKGS